MSFGRLVRTKLARKTVEMGLSLVRRFVMMGIKKLGMDAQNAWLMKGSNVKEVLQSAELGLRLTVKLKLIKLQKFQG